MQKSRYNYDGGSTSTSPVRNCFAEGTAIDLGQGGTTRGFVGYNSGGTIANCHYLNGSDSYATQTNHQALTYSGYAVYVGTPLWDFSVVGDGTIGKWMMAGLPHLQMEHRTTISTPVQLQLMAVNLGATYAVANDIDLSDTDEWNWNGTSYYRGFQPIGSGPSSFFRGSFNGGAHRIKWLSINRPTQDYVGLFGYVSNTEMQIQYFRLQDAEVTGQNYVGTLIGFRASGQTSMIGIDRGAVTGTEDVGGLAGHIEGTGTFYDNYATAEVAGTQDVGGLVGQLSGVNVTDSYATGGASGTSNVGGFIGNLTSATVADSWWYSPFPSQLPIGLGSAPDLAHPLIRDQREATFNNPSAWTKSPPTRPSAAASTWLSRARARTRPRGTSPV